MKKILIILLFSLTSIFNLFQMTNLNATSLGYLSFDGVDDYVLLDDLQSSGWGASELTNYSIEITFSTTTNLIRSLYGTSNTGSDELAVGVALNADTTNKIQSFLRASTPSDTRDFWRYTDSTLFNGTINKIKHTYNSGTSTLHVNDVLKSITYILQENPSNFNNIQHPLALGANNVGGTLAGFSQINIYDFKIYNGTTLFLHYDLSASGAVVGNQLIDQVGNNDATIYGATFVPPADPFPVNVNLDSNYNPFADIVYTSDFLTTTSSIVNDILISQSPIEITTNQSNISPFVFQHWYDLDNNNIFTTSRTFIIPEPNRDYNLRAIYNLTNSIDLTLDSTLPSPPNFNVEVDTIEQQRAFISKYPFNNEEIPFGYNFLVEAPTDNVGVYEFDYWWNNNTNTVFTTSAIISLDAIENYNLTATYSLPEEYQIVLTLFSNIGDITFKLGNQPAITGSFIQVTIGQGDSWTASGPLNPDWQFQSWKDLETSNIFSTNRSFGVSNTTQNYILEATYFPIYDVNWNTLGGTLIPSQRIVSGGTINAPNDPLRPGFAFNGWALPSAPTTPITFPQIVTDNITYQAIWLTTYQLTFNVNGGQPINPQIVIENNIPNVVTPSRFGYTFEGWFTDNITFNNSFNFNLPFTSNTTIHAKWEFGTTANAQTSLNNFLTNARLDNPLAQWIIVLSLFILLNVMIFIYKGPFIVTSVLNFILTAIFIILGFIPIWIIIVLFIGIFGFMILMLSGGRS